MDGLLHLDPWQGLFMNITNDNKYVITWHSSENEVAAGVEINELVYDPMRNSRPPCS
jgi:copper(I)-binding protein